MFNSPPRPTRNHLLLLLFVRCTALRTHTSWHCAQTGHGVRTKLLGNNNNTRIAANANNSKVRESSPAGCSCSCLDEWLRWSYGLNKVYLLSVCVCVASSCWLCSCKTLYSSGIRNELNNLRGIFSCSSFLSFVVVVVAVIHHPSHTKATHIHRHTRSMRTISILFINFPCRKYIIWATKRHSALNWFYIVVYYVLGKWPMCCYSPRTSFVSFGVQYAHLCSCDRCAIHFIQIEWICFRRRVLWNCHLIWTCSVR